MTATTTPHPDADRLRADLDAVLLGTGHSELPATRAAALRARVLAGAADDVRAAAAQAPSPRASRGTRWLAAAAVGAVLVTGAAVVPGAVAEAHAGQVLSETAQQILNAPDLTVGPDQYLKEEHRTTQRDGAQDPRVGESFTHGFTEYVPADPSRDAVRVPLPTVLGDGTTDPAEPSESYRGDAAGAPGLAAWMQLDGMDELPREPAALIRFFRDRHHGGSASSDEDLFVMMTDVLREPGIPADLRGGLIAALAQAPGVRVEDDVTLSDGRTGLGLSRAEPLRMGQVTQVVLDPATGYVMGERSLSGAALGELHVDVLVSESTTRISVVDSAPEADTHRDLVLQPDGVFAEEGEVSYDVG